MQVMQNQQGWNKFLSGAAGAGLAVAISKYNNLSTRAQVLLGAAGFGIGRLIYDYLKQDGQATHYNDKIRSYEMDSSRY